METGEAGGWRAAAQQPPRPSLGLAPRPPPASVCVDCYPTLAAHSMLPIPCCPLHQEQTTAADDVHQGARKHMPSLSFFLPCHTLSLLASTAPDQHFSSPAKLSTRRRTPSPSDETMTLPVL